MKKHLIAVAVAAAVAAPAAMADTTLYGLAHASVDYIKNDVAADKQESNIAVSSNSSRLGVKGTEKLGGGLSAVYQYETTVNLTGDGSTLFGGARNSFVGLTGGFGTALVGIHDTPMKLVGRQYDLFGDTVGDSRNLTSLSGVGVDLNGDGDVTDAGETSLSPGFDLRPKNVIAYVSPEMAGFQAILAYVTDHDVRPTAASAYINDANSSADNNKFDAYSISAGYKHKIFDIAAAYERHNIERSAAGIAAGVESNESAYRIGAGVNFAGLRVNALYQKASNVGFVSDADVKTWGLGAGYTFGKNMVKAQYFQAKDDSDKLASMWAVGYDFNMSKQTALYAAYAHTKNEEGIAGFTATGGGHGDNPSTAVGGKSSAFSVGVKHKF